MKNTKLFFGSLLLCSLSIPSFAANLCVPGICTFTSLDKPSDTAEFYCESSDKVTSVHFQNHNVNITGFDSNGELTLDGPKIAKLKKYYFKVTVDPKRSSSAVKSVTFNIDGETKCSIGKGDRKFPFYAIFRYL